MDDTRSPASTMSRTSEKRPKSPARGLGDRDYGSLSGRGRVECGELRYTLPEHRGVDDGVTAVDRLRLVTGQPGRGRSRDTRPLEVADSGPAEVVGDPAGELGLVRTSLGTRQPVS